MRRAWRGKKYKLHTYFKKIGGEHDLTKTKLSRHEEVKEQADWEYLCDLWSSTSFMERSQQNSDSQSKRKWESKNGSKKTPRHHVTQGRVLADRIGQIETWRTMHFDLKTGWTGPDLQDLYDRMLELRSQNTPEDMSDKDIMERVLGRHSMRLREWARSLSTSTQTDASESTNRRPSYDELLVELAAVRNRLKEVEGGLDEYRQVLRSQGFMPALSNPSHISNQNSGPASRSHSRFYPSTSHPEANPLSTDANEHDST